MHWTPPEPGVPTNDSSGAFEHAEGLCRSAVAVLQASDGKTSPGNRDEVNMDKGKKGKDKTSDDDMGAAPKALAAQPRCRR